MHFSTLIGRAYRGIEAVGLWLAHGALLAMMATTAADALLRYLFNSPLNGVQELADEFFMPALVFFMISNIYSTGGHIRISGVLELFPRAVQRAVLFLCDLAALTMFAMITYGLTDRTIEAYVSREYSSSPLDYLIAPSYGIVAFGSAMMCLRILQAVVTARHPMGGHELAAELPPDSVPPPKPAAAPETTNSDGVAWKRS